MAISRLSWAHVAQSGRGFEQAIVPTTLRLHDGSSREFGSNPTNGNGQSWSVLECVWSVCTCDSSWVVADSLVGGSGKSGVHSLPGASLQLLQCLHGTFIGSWWETFPMWVFGQRHCMLRALNLADLKREVVVAILLYMYGLFGSTNNCNNNARWVSNSIIHTTHPIHTCSTSKQTGTTAHTARDPTK